VYVVLNFIVKSFGTSLTKKGAVFTTLILKDLETEASVSKTTTVTRYSPRSVIRDGARQREVTVGCVKIPPGMMAGDPPLNW
jgi:hypothetical protein